MLLLAGCAAVGPDYVPPRPELPAAWAQGAAVASASPEASGASGASGASAGEGAAGAGEGPGASAAVHASGLRAWWSLFRDPR
ncbi:MAG: hypothetical protein ACLGII_09780, partial [Gammaproteobacteria bacterium]